MKVLLFIGSIFCLLTSPFSWSQEDDSNAVFRQRVSEGEDQESKTLQIIQSVPDAKKQYELCEKVAFGSLDSCLWNGGDFTVTNPETGARESIQVDPLSEEARTEVQKRLYGDNDDTKFALENETVRVKESKAIQNLKKYFEERLQNHLYGETPGLKTVDHKTFNDLFRAQLGKNLISALSSYCIEADPKMGFLVRDNSDARETTRENNIKLLESQAGDQVAASANWGSCISHLQYVCYQEDKEVEISYYDLNDPNQKSYTINYSRAKSEKCAENTGASVRFLSDNPSTSSTNECSGKPFKKKDFDYSKQRSCVVMSYLKKVRSNLIALDSVDEQWENLRERGTSPSLQAGTVDQNGNFQALEVRRFGDSRDDKSIDEIVSLSSNEAINESGYKDGVEKELEEFEECFKEGKVVNADRCKEYLNTDREKAKELISEYSLRTRGVEKKLNELGSSGQEKENQEALKSFLREEGFSEEQIEEELKLGEAEIKEKIRKRYEAERKALIDSFADEIKDKTSVEEGKVTASGSGGNNDESTLQRISDELTDKPDNYKQLVYFNNIVSGFLTFQNEENAQPGQEQEKKRNTASLRLELDNSAYLAEEQDLGSGRSVSSAAATRAADKESFERVRSAIEQTNVDLSENRDQNDDPRNSGVGKDELNSAILFYSKEQKRNP